MTTCRNVHVPQAAPIQDEQDTEHITDDLVPPMSENVIPPGVASKTRGRPQIAKAGLVSSRTRRAPEATRCSRGFRELACAQSRAAAT
jgi:hypothetical protein